MSPTLFPSTSRSYIESFQFSSWHATFSHVSPRAVVIRPLSEEFRAYLEEDGVIVPEGSDDCLSDRSSSSDDEAADPDPGDDDDDDDDGDDDAIPPTRHAFPALDAQIRDAIRRFEAVFPKLNWTSPKDSSWVIPTLRCTSPADVYLLLKSSDFVSHDLNPRLAFAGCVPPPTRNGASTPPSPSTSSAVPVHVHDLELVLKKWYAMDRGREFRCFVRDETLLAITQRDPNYYPHLNEKDTADRVLRSVFEFWAQHVRSKFAGGSDYIFDVHLTRDLCSAHVLDFNPYHPKTDPLLFTYDEVLQLLVSASTSTASDLTTPDFLHGQSITPVLRTISSPSHPAASRNAPTHQHNAIPFDALQMSDGNDIATFSNKWRDELTRNMYGD